MAKYGKKAGEKVERAMHERKHGTLKSGSGGKVKSRKQAIAIGLSEARVPVARFPSARASGRKKEGCFQETLTHYKDTHVSRPVRWPSSSAASVALHSIARWLSP